MNKTTLMVFIELLLSLCAVSLALFSQEASAEAPETPAEITAVERIPGDDIQAAEQYTPEEPIEEAVDIYREDVPLARDLQYTLWEACQDSGIPYDIGLGLIETESRFNTDAVSKTGDYGLCQLNSRYFETNLTPAENIRTGIGYLGALLERYGDMEAALTSYNAGHDTGSRVYASAVLAAAERWAE